MPSERIFVIGGPGTGKTTFANEIGERTGLPVHHLDDVARVGGGTGPERTPEQRAESVAEILATGRWIAEGVHIGWTEPLMEAADLIVWLDHTKWRRSSTRIVRRFVSQAVAEAGQRRGRAKFMRFRDYGRRLRDLAVAIPETRRYQREQARDGGEIVSRAATEKALAPYESKLIRCQTPSDLDAALARIT